MSLMNRIDIIYLLFKHKDDFNINNLLNKDDSTNGFIFETLFQILVIFKCINGINYTSIYDGQLHTLNEIFSIKDFFDKPLHQGNNASDLTIKDSETFIAFSVKYKNKFISDLSGVSKIKAAFEKYDFKNWKIGLVVKDKKLVNPDRKLDLVEKDNHENVIKNKLLFDLADIIKGVNYFNEKYSSIDQINNFIINKRTQLILKVHQQMFYLLLIKTNGNCCLSNKPRSGKSIIILKYSNYCLQNGMKKILIITAVKGTIDDFKKALNKYTDFENVNYDDQENFKNIDKLFNGIVFCTIQYLKTDYKKKEQLDSLNFDLIFFDECHLGGTTNKTKELLNLI